MHTFLIWRNPRGPIVSLESQAHLGDYPWATKPLYSLLLMLRKMYFYFTVDRSTYAHNQTTCLGDCHTS